MMPTSSFAGDTPPPYEAVAAPSYAASNELLPAYTNDTRIVPRKNERDGETVKFELPDPARVYQLGDLLIGELVICPVQDMPVDAITVDFLLVESTTMSDGHRMPRMVRKTSVCQNHVPRHCLPADLTLKHGLQYTFPLSILIPYSLPPTACDQSSHSDMHSLLPPALGAPFDYSMNLNHPDDLPDACARVSYGLRARLTHDTVKVRDAFHAVGFAPAYPMDEFLPDYAGEYSSSKSIRRGMLRKTQLGKCSLAVADPTTNLKISRSHPATLDLNVNFAPSHPSDSPPQIHKMTYRIRSFTYLTPSRLKRPPKNCPNRMKPCVQTVCRRKFEMRQLNWKRANDGNRRSYSALAHLPLFLPDVQKVVPTFSTCLVSRHYEVEVQLFLDSHSNESIVLQVPLIVLLDSQVPLSPAPHHRTSVSSLESISTINNDDDNNTSISIFDSAPRILRTSSITKQAIANNLFDPDVVEDF
jgi:hypothetical protein